MKVEDQIKDYINSHSEPKRSDMNALQALASKVLPGGKLWYMDGKDENGKVVTNPNVGFGSYLIKYANGTSREFYQLGFTANSSGISVYIMGIPDRKYLPDTYGKKIGKAKVTGYCINFKELKDIHLDVLEEAMRYGVKVSATQ